MPCSVLTLTFVLLTAPPPEPTSLSVNGKPLLDVIESRLVSGDVLVRRKDGRPMRPTDKWFRYRFHSQSLVESLQPAFPAGLPGTLPLLEHADSRVRCAALLILEKWLLETRRSDELNRFAALSKEDRQRLRVALLKNVANPKLEDASLFAGDRALEIFCSLAETPLTATEEAVLLQKLKTENPQYHRQIIQLFLTVKPVRFPRPLQAPLRQLLVSKSERGRIVLLLQALDTAPAELQAVLRGVLQRDPDTWSADRLALLLSRSGCRDPVLVPGLIAVFNQQIPPRGGMMGRGSLSFFVPGSPNRWSVLQEREHAGRILMTLPVDQPQVLPDLMTLLDADDYATREMGVAAIARFGSTAFIALPKLLTMNTTDNRPRGRIQLIGVSFGLRPAVSYTVTRIAVATVVDIHCWRISRLWISSVSLLADRLRQPVNGSRSSAGAFCRGPDRTDRRVSQKAHCGAPCDKRTTNNLTNSHFFETMSKQRWDTVTPTLANDSGQLRQTH